MFLLKKTVKIKFVGNEKVKKVKIRKICKIEMQVYEIGKVIRA